MTGSFPRFDAAYYRAHTGPDGPMPYERNDHWLGFFGDIAEEITRRLGPSSVLDVGCAHGFLVEALVQRGVDAHGFDCSEYAISQAQQSIADRVWVGSITEPVDGRYDLVTCIEVVEHVPSHEVGRATKQLTSVTDAILLSSTAEDVEEPTHLNVQPPEYWAELLAGHGFHRDTGFDATFVSPWAALYRRREVELPALVRDLERDAWRMRTERDRLRRALLEASQGDVGSGTEELQLVAEELRHDLRVAVDSVREAQAERGTAMGRLREVENLLAVAKEREKEFVDLVARIDVDAAEARRAYEELLRSRSFRVFSRVLRPYRRLRGR